LREAKDIAGAEELCRRLEAYRRYVSDRVTRDAIAAETRRTEILIGELLGPAVEGRPQKTSHAREVSIPKNDRVRFRLLAEHAELVEESLSRGFVQRSVLIEQIRYAQARKARTTQRPPSVRPPPTDEELQRELMGRIRQVLSPYDERHCAAALAALAREYEIDAGRRRLVGG